MPLNYSSKTQKNPNKSKNGDHVAYKVLAQEQLVIAVLADGVGSCPCDWKASQTACQLFLEAWEEPFPTAILPLFEDTLHQINAFIRAEAGACQGMKTTFCAAVWDLQKELLYYTNIGDSRIYSWEENSLLQLSQDALKTTVQKQKNGQDLAVEHITVLEKVTAVLGQDQLQFDIKTTSTTAMKALLLSSDGFHHLLADFEKENLAILNNLHLQPALEQVYQQYKSQQKDDMTVLLIRKVIPTEQHSTIITTLLKQQYPKGHSLLVITQAIMQALEESLHQQNSSAITTLLAFVEQQKIDLGKQALGRFISIMVQEDFQDRGIYQQLLQLMRGSRV